MAGRRPLEKPELRILIKVLRRTNPRDRALVTTGLFGGLRSVELRRLTVGQVWCDRRIVTQIGIPPRGRKGGRGVTLWVPVGPELHRALEKLIAHRLQEEGEIALRSPLFVSRHRGPDALPRPLGRKQVYRIVMDCFRRAHITRENTGTHSLRKTHARAVYEASGHDLLVTRDALGHASAATTERYLSIGREVVHRAVLATDWTRSPRPWQRSAAAR